MTLIESGVYAAPQIDAEDIKDAAARGVVTIVCNRPDHEDPGQPTADEIAALAQQAGLRFEHLPIVGGQLPAEYVERMQTILSSDGDVLAYCRSGMRSTVLWAAARAASGTPIDELIRTANKAGYDISAVRPILEEVARQC